MSSTRFDFLAWEDAGSTHRSAMAAGAVGAGVSVVAVCLAFGAKVELFASCPRFSGTVVFAALTSLTLVALVVGKKLGGRAGAVASLATLGWLPIVFLGLAVAHDPVITRWRCGTGQMGALVMGPLLAFPTLVGSSLLAMSARHARLDGLIRQLAFASLIVTGIATTGALLHSQRPDADTYRASLPVLRTLSVGQSLILDDGSRVTYRRSGLAPASKTESEARRGRCQIDGITGAGDATESCAALLVRHDPKAGVWVLGDDTAMGLAFRGDEKILRDIETRDVATSIAAPIGWTLGGVLAVVLQIVLLAQARKLRRERAAFDGVEATLQADGWVAIDGKPPVTLAGTAGLPPGPIVLQLGPEQMKSYRETGSGALEGWRRGTLADAREALAARATTFHALALSSGLLCAAPLLLTGLGGSR